MLERWFRLNEHGTTIRTEVVAGCVTFLTMAYIVVVQPAVLSGAMFGAPTGMDAGALVTATCLASALATALMALYARFPIALAPGMGENFFFFGLCSSPAIVAATAGEAPWRGVLAVVFASGVLFLLITMTGARRWLLDAISPSLKHAMAAGIGLFIAFIGLRNAGVVVAAPGSYVTLTHHLASPDVLLFFFGLLVTAALAARRVTGAIFWGIVATACAAALLREAIVHVPLLADWQAAPQVAGSQLMTRWQAPDAIVAAPPSLAPVFMQMDFRVLAYASVWPLVMIFLFMAVFDTLGTLVAVTERAGLVRDGKLPRAERALVTDAVGTTVGAALGTSTVTCYIESAAGVESGGRTGLTSLVTALLFLGAMFFSPLVEALGGYPPLTAPALVMVGSWMVAGAANIAWSDPTEALPAFLVVVGIPLFSSIADGIGLGLLAYAVLKLLAGRWRELHPMMYAVALLLAVYFVAVRSAA